jgi:hypothetical protein
MYRLALILLASITLTGCLKEEFAPLEGNIFEDDLLGIFVLESVSRDTINQTRSNITVNFTSIWGVATPEQKATITGLRIEGPRSDMAFTVPAETTSHTMNFVRHEWRNCIELTFLTIDEVNTRTSEICVTP